MHIIKNSKSFFNVLLIDSFNANLKKKNVNTNDSYFKLRLKNLTLGFNRNIIYKHKISEFSKISNLAHANKNINFITYFFENTLFSYSLYLNKFWRLSFYIKKDYKLSTITYFLIGFIFFKKHLNFDFLTIFFNFFKLISNSNTLALIKTPQYLKDPQRHRILFKSLKKEIVYNSTSLTLSYNLSLNNTFTEFLPFLFYFTTPFYAVFFFNFTFNFLNFNFFLIFLSFFSLFIAML